MPSTAPWEISWQLAAAKEFMQQKLRSLVIGVLALIACATATPLSHEPQNFVRSPETGEVVNIASPELTLAEVRAAAALTDASGRLPFGVNPSDYDISIQSNERVEHFIEYFGNQHHDRFAMWLSRMARFETHIRERLLTEGLPGDLVYLAMIESGFSPDAVSSARAVGLWQLMEGTARLEGLEVSTYVDERRDPIKSTDAAIRHLKGINSVFGSWYLTAAAYNSGASRVARTLKAETGSVRGGDSLFWKIDALLPAETRNYVPQLIAAAIIAKNPERFGFGDVPRQQPTPYELIPVTGATDLAAIAMVTGSTVAEIRALNPQLYRGVTPPKRTVQVRVPEGTAEGLAAALAKLPARERVTNLTHTARKGEKLGTIASRYGVTLAALKSANRIKEVRPLKAGRRLVIPISVPSATRLAATAPEPSKKKSSATRKSTASTKKLASARTSAKKPAGKAVASKASSAKAKTVAASKSPATVVHKVRAGDSLVRIAERYGVSVAKLRSLNDLGSRSVIRPGQRLIVRRAPVPKQGAEPRAAE
jgi:membrane-bound lytic murein transglycosylase D